jgi:hypothetical protein
VRKSRSLSGHRGISAVMYLPSVIETWCKALCLGCHHSWSGTSDWPDKFKLVKPPRKRRSAAFYTLSAHRTVTELPLNEHHSPQDNPCSPIAVHARLTSSIADASFRSHTPHGQPRGEAYTRAECTGPTAD